MPPRVLRPARAAASVVIVFVVVVVVVVAAVAVEEVVMLGTLLLLLRVIALVSVMVVDEAWRGSISNHFSKHGDVGRRGLDRIGG